MHKRMDMFPASAKFFVGMIGIDGLAQSENTWGLLVAISLLGGRSLYGADRIAVELHNERADVLAVYAYVRTLSADEAKAHYRTQRAPMQEDLWSVHLERFVDQHPALTADQRAVIFEALGLLASGVIHEARDSTGSAAVPAYEAVSRLEYRAKTMLGRALAQEALSALVPTDSSARVESPAANAHAIIRTDVGRYPPCDCSSESSWCDSITNPTPKCKSGGCTPYDGCGTFWLYMCDGICSQGAPVP